MGLLTSNEQGRSFLLNHSIYSKHRHPPLLSRSPGRTRRASRRLVHEMIVFLIAALNHTYTRLGPQPAVRRVSRAMTSNCDNQKMRRTHTTFVKQKTLLRCRCFRGPISLCAGDVSCSCVRCCRSRFSRSRRPTRRPRLGACLRPHA